MSACEEVRVLTFDHTTGLRCAIQVINLDSLPKFETTALGEEIRHRISFLSVTIF